MSGPLADLQARRVGECGCPEEVYLFDGLDLTIHFEPNGDVDGHLDGGYWGEATTTGELGHGHDEGRRAIFAWAASLIHGPEQ